MAKVPSPRERFEKVLRDAGLRVTQPRLKVLALLEDASSPVSHADLATALEDEGFDRATVYRNLVDLTRTGLLRRADVGDHTWRFELVSAKPTHPQHPHFVCSTCGTVTCLEDARVQIEAPRKSPRVVRTQKVEVQLRGVCDRCN